MMSRRRWLAGWGLLAGTYLTLALKHVVTGGDPGSVAVYLVAATITFAFAAAVLPIMVPRNRPGGDDPRGDGGVGSPPEAGDGPQPPWWPEFERRFWEHLEHPAGRPARSPESVPTAQPRRR